MAAALFIPPCLPTPRHRSPSGKGWLHELKFDGWRLQLHRGAGRVRLYSIEGDEFTRRYPSIVGAMLHLPCSVVIDAELTACTEDGRPDVGALVRGATTGLRVWCFDLLAIHGNDLRAQPLAQRKERLARMIAAAGDARLRYSNHFDDMACLLKTCKGRQPQGIVSKQKKAPYRAGPSGDWVKVNCIVSGNEELWWRGKLYGTTPTRDDPLPFTRR